MYGEEQWGQIAVAWRTPKRDPASTTGVVSNWMVELLDAFPDRLRLGSGSVGNWLDLMMSSLSWRGPCGGHEKGSAQFVGSNDTVCQSSVRICVYYVSVLFVCCFIAKACCLDVAEATRARHQSLTLRTETSLQRLANSTWPKPLTHAFEPKASAIMCLFATKFPWGDWRDNNSDLDSSGLAWFRFLTTTCQMYVKRCSIFQSLWVRNPFEDNYTCVPRETLVRAVAGQARWAPHRYTHLYLYSL